MLETYFSAPKTLRRLRSGISGPHIDAFADDLERDGYAPSSAVRYIRAAAHLGCFMQRRGHVLADIDFNTLHAFAGHLRRCQCPHFKRAKIGFHARFGAKLFHQRLVDCGICAREPARDTHTDPVLISAFRDWFQTHRGVKEPTLRQYTRGAVELVQALGEDVGQWTSQAVRNFILERSRRCGAPTTQKLVTSLRAFLRYLNFCGESRNDLALAIPAFAHWRLAKLPRCLSTEEVSRLIAACDCTDPGRLRDRAIVLMLVRLGLRSGDVAQLRLADIDWNSSTLQVIGKGRYQVRLPLPQDVGDAMLRYLEQRPAPIAIPITYLFAATPLTGPLPPETVFRPSSNTLSNVLASRLPPRGRTCCVTPQPPRCYAMASP